MSPLSTSVSLLNRPTLTGTVSVAFSEVAPLSLLATGVSLTPVNVIVTVVVVVLSALVTVKVSVRVSP